MKKYILLMLLISCQEEETLKRRNPFMTISNAIPVQFWVNGVETYNEKQICGVEPVCFCQPFNCDDEIRIQFQDNSATTYNLHVLDSDGNELQSILFDDVASGVWQVNFIPENYGVCNENIQLKIIADYSIVDSEFLTTLDGWTNSGGGTTNWAWNAANSGCANLQFTDSSGKDLRKSLTIPSGIIIDGNLYIDYQVVGSFGSMVALIKDSGGNIIYTSTPITGTGTTNFTIPNSVLLNAAFIDIDVTGSGLGVAYTFRVNELTLTVDNQVLAQSDCLDIKTDHDCTVLLEYTNSEDFNNIVYLTSPTSEYKLRIPAQFWKEDNPMEQEDSELSNGVIKTRRQTITQKRYLEIGYLPNYMHLKTQLALMHDSLTIEGDQWKKRDAYESESIKRYPLKRANVWLTLYNSIDDNIL